MITATDLELRAGARILLEPTTLRVQPGDRIGLVGRNGAGKTTMLRIFAGEVAAARRPDRTLRPGRLPAAGPAHRRPGRARPRPGALRPRPRHPRHRHRQGPGRSSPRRPHDERAAAPLRLARGALHRARRLRGGERGRADLRQPRPARPGARPAAAARCPAASGAGSSSPGSCSPTPAPSRPRCCWTSRPTTSTPTRSSGCATSCASTPAAWSLISHDVGLLDAVVNKVWNLDANRAVVDVYNVGWKTYLQQREADERRRHRERANAERKIEALRSQADKMRAKATKARAAHQMDRRAAVLAAGLAEVRTADKVARLRFPAPARADGRR